LCGVDEDCHADWSAWRHVFDGAWRETSLAAATPGGGAFVQVCGAHMRGDFVEAFTHGVA